MATYTIILLLYVVPLAASFFGNTYFPKTKGTDIVNTITVTSPFAAAFNVPIYMEDYSNTDGGWQPAQVGQPQFFGYPLKDIEHFGGYVVFTILLNCVLFGMMIWMFNSRWRVSTSTE